MTLITDGLLIAAAVFAGVYCFVLSRRLRALKDLDAGLGAAILRMTRALEEARRALEEAKSANRDGSRELKDLIVRAETASGQLRILLSATRDLPAPRAARPAPSARSYQEDGDEPTIPGDRSDPDEPPLAAPRARREALPIAAHALAPAVDPFDGVLRRAPAPPRRPQPAPASEDDLLAALADFAGARV